MFGMRMCGMRTRPSSEDRRRDELVDCGEIGCRGGLASGEDRVEGGVTKEESLAQREGGRREGGRMEEAGRAGREEG